MLFMGESTHLLLENIVLFTQCFNFFFCIPPPFPCDYSVFLTISDPVSPWVLFSQLIFLS